MPEAVIPYPEFPVLYPKQYKAFYSDKRIVITEASTKAGKSVGALTWLFEKGWEGGEGKSFAWMAPINKSAMEIGYRGMKEFLEQWDENRRFWREVVSKQQIEIIDKQKRTHCRFNFFGSEDPDNVYGYEYWAGVVDEGSRCFAAGTPVCTPGGPRPIESLRVGDQVFNASGVGNVTSVTASKHTAIAVVMLQGYTMVSSVDHLYFTQRGWVEARHLNGSDTLVSQAEALSYLRGGVYFSQQEAAFLRDQLLSEVEDDSARSSCQGTRSRDKRENACGLAGVLAYRSTGGEDEKRFGGKECNGSSRCSNESIEYSQGQVSDGAGRQRQGLNCASVDASGEIRRWVRGRVLRANTNTQMQGWASNALQDRYCQSRNVGGNRNRWPVTRNSQEKGSGQKKRSDFVGARVDRVEVFESGSGGYARYSGGEGPVILYDIGVSGHPSFSVNGFLVHNCKEESWQALFTTMTFTKGQIRIIGNVKNKASWMYRLGELARKGSKLYGYQKITAIDAMQAGVLEKEAIDAARETLPDAIFERDYMAVPHDDARAFFRSQVIEKQRDMFARSPVRMRFNLAEQGFSRDPGGDWYCWGGPEFTKKTNYIFGIDISAGIAGSNSVIAVMDKETGEVVAEYVSPNIAPEDLATMAMDTGKTVFAGQAGSALICWEANGPGEGWFRHMLRAGYTNIYYQHREGTKGERKGRKYGWHSSRPLKLDRLGDMRAAMADMPGQRRRIVIHSDACLDEMGRYIYMDDGSVGPDTVVDITTGARASHGDRVIAYMLCLMASTDSWRYHKPKIKAKPGTFADRFKMDKYIDLAEYEHKSA